MWFCTLIQYLRTKYFEPSYNISKCKKTNKPTRISLDQQELHGKKINVHFCTLWYLWSDKNKTALLIRILDVQHAWLPSYFAY